MFWCIRLPGIRFSFALSLIIFGRSRSRQQRVSITSITVLCKYCTWRFKTCFRYFVGLRDTHLAPNTVGGFGGCWSVHPPKPLDLSRPHIWALTYNHLLNLQGGKGFSIFRRIVTLLQSTDGLFKTILIKHNNNYWHKQNFNHGFYISCYYLHIQNINRGFYISCNENDSLLWYTGSHCNFKSWHLW